MKKVVLFACLVPLFSYAQVHEDFEAWNPGNWIQSSPGRWSADASGALSGARSLHHVFDNQASGTDAISIRLNNFRPEEGTSRWSFLLKHGCEPSSSNNWAVFLVSDREAPQMGYQSDISGYAIGVNITGYDDSLRLVRFVKGSPEPVLTCRVNWQIDAGMTDFLRIEVERSQSGTWIVSALRSTGELLSRITGSIPGMFSPVCAGIIYRYTATRDRLLWIDDFRVEGIFRADTEPPSVTGCKEHGKNSVIVSFSEEPRIDCLVPGNFTVNGIGAEPVKITRQSPAVYILDFGRLLKNHRENILHISRLCDCEGNCRENVTAGFIPSWPETGDVIFTEIMADPVPAVALPEKEFMEILNRTEYRFALSGWKLCSPGAFSPMPDKVLEPHSQMILCGIEDTALFSRFGRVAGIRQFPVLNDGGKMLWMTDSTGMLMHGVDYSDEWYNDNLRRDGGWSLEMIDTGFPFHADGNWRASRSPAGGTPGHVNSVSSVNPDNEFPGVENVFPADSLKLIISFPEPVFSLKEGYFTITGGINPLSLLVVDPLYRKFILALEQQLEINKTYTLTLRDDLSDFAGNRIVKREFDFGLPVFPVAGDILFNEVLFNPMPGGADYIELFNASSKIIDAGMLRVVSVDDETGDTSALFRVSPEGRCIMPGRYHAITTDAMSVLSHYSSAGRDNLFRVPGLPSMPDESGHLILFTYSMEKLDEFRYSDKMHYPLLASGEGISLEKTDPFGSSSGSYLWHSASEYAGGGTPGAVNSVYSPDPVESDVVTLSSSRLTPDGNGTEDILSIHLDTGDPGTVTDITIFDEAGNFVARPASRLLAGSHATVVWDGTARDGSAVRNGIYVILVSYYSAAGRTGKVKKSCTVIR